MPIARCAGNAILKGCGCVGELRLQAPCLFCRARAAELDPLDPRRAALAEARALARITALPAAVAQSFRPVRRGHPVELRFLSWLCVSPLLLRFACLGALSWLFVSRVCVPAFLSCLLVSHTRDPHW